MKKTVFVILILFALVATACQPLAAPPEVVVTEEVQDIPVATEPLDTEPKAPEVVQVTIDYADNFTLEYKDGYKLLTVTQPWAGSSQAYVYALVPKSAGDVVVEENALVIQTPVENFVSLSSTYYPFLDQIGELESLIAVDDATYIYNPTVRVLAESGAIAQIGGGSSMAAVDMETLIELNPALIMTSASGLEEYDVHPQMLEAGLPVVINSDYLEQSPLGRAEWGKFIAAFFEKEAEADVFFDEAVADYMASKELTAGITDRVTVFTNTDYQGTWYMPGRDSYVALLLGDAGADYLWNDLEGTGSLPLSFEVVLERAQNADYWLNIGFASTLEDLLAMDARYADFGAYQNGNIYNFNKRVNENGGVDYYESGVAHPELVLRDLIRIFYPDLLPEHELFYYQQLQ